MLGHTNTRMTAHYAKLIDKCIGEQMDKLMDTFTGDSDYYSISYPQIPHLQQMQVRIIFKVTRMGKINLSLLTENT